MDRLGSREFWVPGWRQGFIFILIALLGLGAWMLKETALSPLSDVGGLYMVFAGEVVLYALLALAAGFLAPRGFYLWGAAIVLLQPFAVLAQAALQESRGLDIVRGGARAWANYAIVLVVLAIIMATLTTTLSAAGAGLRLLSDHLRERRAGTRGDV